MTLGYSATWRGHAVGLRFREQEFAFVPLGGLTRSAALEGFAWLAHDFLGDAVRGFVILDRDYRSEDECHSLREKFREWGLTCHIWKRHEIENYLLVPGVIARLSGASEDDVRQLLQEALDECVQDVIPGMIGCRLEDWRAVA